VALVDLEDLGDQVGLEVQEDLGILMDLVHLVVLVVLVDQTDLEA
jgi:hypothetical protein